MSALETSELECQLQQVAARINSTSKRLLFITGAGLSADSGLPTYRGVNGLYEKQLTEEAMPIEQALSGEMLLQNPNILWRHIGQIEQACRNATFNTGHRAIAELEQAFDVTVLTQNIDGFHRDAGSTKVIEMHGTIRGLVCTQCDYSATVDHYAGLPLPPYCMCGGLLRPTVVLFGEMLPDKALAQWHQAAAKGFDAVFSIGTTSVFPYIAEPVYRAAVNGHLTVEVNPATTPVSEYCEFKFSQSAAIVLPHLARLMLAQ